jgi:flagellar biosynthetic protein FliR
MNGFAAVAGLSLLLVRPGMLVLATPFFGSTNAPATIRIGLTLILAILLAPIVSVPAAPSATALVAIVLREMAIGLALALSVRALIAGAEFAGHYTGLQIGLSMGSLIDPQTGVRNNIIALLYGSLAVIICFGFNLHHALLRVLVDTYTTLPIGLGGLDPSLAGGVAQLFGTIVVLGVRIAAPVVVVLLLVEVALGLLARVAPALNVMIAGLPVRMAVGLLVVAATVGVLPTLLARYAPAVLQLDRDMAGAFR